MLTDRRPPNPYYPLIRQKQTMLALSQGKRMLWVTTSGWFLHEMIGGLPWAEEYVRNDDKVKGVLYVR